MEIHAPHWMPSNSKKYDLPKKNYSGCSDNEQNQHDLPPSKHLCVCVWHVAWGYISITFMWKSQLNLKCHSSNAVDLALWDRVSHWLGTHHEGQVGWPSSPRDLPVSSSLEPGLQACATMPSFYAGLGIKLTISYMHNKPFTIQTISTAALKLL